jgi:hypothetical protein
MTFLPAKIGFDMWVGNHTTIRRAFRTVADDGTKSPLSLTGKDVIVTVYHGDDKLVEKSTLAGSVTVQGDDDEEITCTFTPEETRTIADRDYVPGERPMHEIEIRSGSIESTWVYGPIKLRGGDNVDDA